MNRPSFASTRGSGCGLNEEEKQLQLKAKLKAITIARHTERREQQSRRNLEKARLSEGGGSSSSGRPSQQGSISKRDGVVEYESTQGLTPPRQSEQQWYGNGNGGDDDEAVDHHCTSYGNGNGSSPSYPLHQQNSINANTTYSPSPAGISGPRCSGGFGSKALPYTTPIQETANSYLVEEFGVPPEYRSATLEPRPDIGCGLVTEDDLAELGLSSCDPETIALLEEVEAEVLARESAIYDAVEAGVNPFAGGGGGEECGELNEPSEEEIAYWMSLQ